MGENSADDPPDADARPPTSGPAIAASFVIVALIFVFLDLTERAEKFCLHSLVSPLRFAVTVFGVGLALLVALLWREVRGVARWFPSLAIYSAIITFLAVWPLTVPLVEWANVALDHTPARRLAGRLALREYRTRSHRKGVTGERYLAELVVDISDPDVGTIEVSCTAFPGDAVPPAAGSPITMDLHRGRLGVPWVDQLHW